MASNDDPHALDGNALAGLLSEMLAVDATTVLRTCEHCGQQHPIGAHRAYEGAGIVLRCPGCGCAALTFAVSEQHISARLHGVFRLERPS